MTQPKLRQQINSLVTPGERIGSVNARGIGEKLALIAGKGTYIRQVSELMKCLTLTLTQGASSFDNNP